MKFLKNFGWGLLTILLLPIFLVLLAIGAVYLIVVFFYQMFLSLIRFFRGEKGPLKLPEDRMVEAIKAEKLRQQMPQEAKQPEQALAPSPTPTNVYIQHNYYQQQQNPSPSPEALPKERSAPIDSPLNALPKEATKAPEPKVIDVTPLPEKKPEPLSLEGVSPEVQKAIEEALKEQALEAHKEPVHDVIDLTKGEDL